MKALSIRQPWVYAIFNLGKTIENRDWWTDVRGRIAIHVSGSVGKQEYEDAKNFIYEVGRPGVLVPSRDSMTLGSIVGTVEITNCITRSQSPWFVGKFGFVLRDPVPLPEPIPFKGMLGFWDVSNRLLFHVCERCGRSRNGHALSGGMHEPGACSQFVGEFDL